MDINNYDEDGYKKESNLSSNIKNINFDQIPEELKAFLKDLKIDDYDNYADNMMKDREIYFNTYQSSQFYCIPESLEDMKGQGDTRIFVQYNINLVSETRIYTVGVKVYEKNDITKSAYVIMFLDYDTFLILELC